MNDRQRRIARARLLRREGKTYNEIRAALDIAVSDEELRSWLRGISRPRATHRTRRRDDLREECRRLRAQGLTYDEIAAKTGASKGSISPWVRDVRVPAAARKRHRANSEATRKNVGRLNRERGAARREEFRVRAEAQLGTLTDRDLFMVGLALYWAEGSKDKAWRRNGRVVLINSDPTLLSLFLGWLDLVGVPEEDRTYRLAIHDSADVPAHELWWCDRLQVPLASFARATLKRHKPVTVRRNVDEDYHGCLTVSVCSSGWLYYSIEGWWRGLVRRSGLDADGDGRMDELIRCGEVGIPSDFGSEVPGSIPGSGAVEPSSPDRSEPG